MIQAVCAVGPNYVGIATLVTAGVGGLVLIYNTMHTRSTEEKIDGHTKVLQAADIVQAAIKTDVNSNMTTALKKIDEGTQRFDAATTEIAELKTAALAELKEGKLAAVNAVQLEMAALKQQLAERDHQNGYDEPRPRRRRAPPRGGR
jgi:hypothetical protein